MKQKILAFLLVLCFIIPAAYPATAQAAQYDADGNLIINFTTAANCIWSPNCTDYKSIGDDFNNIKWFKVINDETYDFRFDLQLLNEVQNGKNFRIYIYDADGNRIWTKKVKAYLDPETVRLQDGYKSRSGCTFIAHNIPAGTCYIGIDEYKMANAPGQDTDLSNKLNSNYYVSYNFSITAVPLDYELND